VQALVHLLQANLFFICEARRFVIGLYVHSNFLLIV
jgi:hypothetical protein